MPPNMPSSSAASVASGFLPHLPTSPHSSPLDRHKPSVSISLDNHYTSRFYTTGSTISGTAAVLATHAVPFDSVEISFFGIARTRTNAVHLQCESARVFLRMAMPVDPHASYPVPRVFEAGRVYEFPFSFVVPRQLTISACGHPVEGDHVREEHLRLPPSMGFWRAAAGPAGPGRDDMAPEMSQVEYLVKASVMAQPDLSVRPVRLMTGVHPVSVLPASAEAPPLDISGPALQIYTTCKTKSIRKGLLSGKIGRLTASAVQPRTVFLSPDGRIGSSSSATINLTFTPSSSSSSADTIPAPPSIHSVTAKISATTYFNSTAMNKLPNMSAPTPGDFSATDLTTYTTSTTLFAAGFDSVPWRQAHSKRDSSYESGSTGYESSPPYTLHDTRPTTKKPSTSSSSSKKHTARESHAALTIPFTLPTDRKLFLPTFHSCLISRIYTLHLSISAGPTSTALNLALPLQVAVEESAPLSSSFETALAERGADEHLRPRVLGVVDDAVVGGSRGILPGYSAAVGAGALLDG